MYTFYNLKIYLNKILNSSPSMRLYSREDRQNHCRNRYLNFRRSYGNSRNSSRSNRVRRSFSGIVLTLKVPLVSPLSNKCVILNYFRCAKFLHFRANVDRKNILRFSPLLCCINIHISQ